MLTAYDYVRLHTPTPPVTPADMATAKPTPETTDSPQPTHTPVKTAPSPDSERRSEASNAARGPLLWVGLFIILIAGGIFVTFVVMRGRKS